MQDAAVAADRHVERCVVVEAMLPLHLEAEEADIEFTRLGNVEDAQMGVTASSLGMVTQPFERVSGEAGRQSLFQLEQPFEIAALDVGAQRIAEPLADRFQNLAGTLHVDLVGHLH